MFKSEEQFHFALPIAAIRFFEWLAKQPAITPVIKGVVVGPEWQTLLAVEGSGSSSFKIDQTVTPCGPDRRSERLVVAVDEDFQVSWIVQAPDGEWLRLSILSQEKGLAMWRNKCDVQLHWEDQGPADLLALVDAIRTDRWQAFSFDQYKLPDKPGL